MNFNSYLAHLMCKIKATPTVSRGKINIAQRMMEISWTIFPTQILEGQKWDLSSKSLLQRLTLQGIGITSKLNLLHNSCEEYHSLTNSQQEGQLSTSPSRARIGYQKQWQGPLSVLVLFQYVLILVLKLPWNTGVWHVGTKTDPCSFGLRGVPCRKRDLENLSGCARGVGGRKKKIEEAPEGGKPNDRGKLRAGRKWENLTRVARLFRDCGTTAIQVPVLPSLLGPWTLVASRYAPCHLSSLTMLRVVMFHSLRIMSPVTQLKHSGDITCDNLVDTSRPDTHPAAVTFTPLFRTPVISHPLKIRFSSAIYLSTRGGANLSQSRQVCVKTRLEALCGQREQDSSAPVFPPIPLFIQEPDSLSGTRVFSLPSRPIPLDINTHTCPLVTSAAPHQASLPISAVRLLHNIYSSPATWLAWVTFESLLLECFHQPLQCLAKLTITVTQATCYCLFVCTQSVTEHLLHKLYTTTPFTICHQTATTSKTLSYCLSSSRKYTCSLTVSSSGYLKYFLLRKRIHIFSFVPSDGIGPKVSTPYNISHKQRKEKKSPSSQFCVSELLHGTMAFFLNWSPLMFSFGQTLHRLFARHAGSVPSGFCAGWQASGVWVDALMIGRLAFAFVYVATGRALHMPSTELAKAVFRELSSPAILFPDTPFVCLLQKHVESFQFIIYSCTLQHSGPSPSAELLPPPHSAHPQHSSSSFSSSPTVFPIFSHVIRELISQETPLEILSINSQSAASPAVSF
ncbi:hypothetical protein VP01_391g2 [Puccinia sorghi]|uniref:Uncharacterized protein n=1 Tax=Puccinia sorghi TaxID=27349 RepID=A0A0L6USN1_9BASI|nr:hypothetical protein VP01_391g2 [Puccinia sorghi]